MDYQLENLGDERFQELCQALLVREFPDVQCFPVGMPDGGRDAVRWFYVTRGEKAFSVFQVKYVRKPLAEDDPHKWLEKTLEGEVEKIRTLVPKGAKSYYLLTNVPGTSHLKSGSMDKVQAILSKALPVPAVCWWRDDLNRRLDNAYALKWAYPEILSGPDMLHLIVESGLSEHRERRASALKAFVRAQYDQDETVRFKQVDLQNRLLGLFVDVPVSPRTLQGDRRYSLFERIKHQANKGKDHEQLGGAAFLLDSGIEQCFRLIVLEGAPGQGKSTLGQYICQAHRARVLQDTEALAALPDEHRPLSVKVPFRVDLRDLAT